MRNPAMINGPLPLERPAGTASFSKFIALLRLVADSDHPATITELAFASGYPRPTVHRMVAGLVAERLLVESADGGGLTLGPVLIQLASRSWERSELRAAASAVLKTLRDRTGETVHLAVPGDMNMIYVDKLDGPGGVQMASRIGTTVMLHSTSVGKCYLAALPTDQAERILEGVIFEKFTVGTVSTVEDLRKQLEEIRARGGWAIDDEENEQGIRCFGAPILDTDGQPVAAVSVSTLKFRQKANLMKSYILPLLTACLEISNVIRNHS